ncbi:MAG: hypothetical protein D6775_11010 [Caldilineae bacterium]|nr:MAG: hypothetical protein D6775_11010 [Caldilineae bacterium]
MCFPRYLQTDAVAVDVGSLKGDTTMKRLTWWFRAVGIFYVLLGIGFIPALNAARLPMMVSNFDAPIGGAAYRALLDYTFMFGLEMMVVGGFLLYASRAPHRHLNLVWLIVWLELVRGIFDDMYMIARGYEPAVMLGFTALHLIIIGTGVLFVRKVQRGTREKVTGQLSLDRL